MARKFLTPIDLNKLELQNARIQNLTSDPMNPVAGQIYYNTGDSQLKYYNGGASAWQVIGQSIEQLEDAVADLITAGQGVSVTYDDDNGLLTIANTGVRSVTGTADEVEVSASAGAVTISLPSTINADTTGNAATATALETARTISFAGALSGSASFDGTQDITITAQLDAEDAVSSITGTPNEVEVSASVGAVTIGLPSTIYVDVQGDLTGNADTASALETARTISLGGSLSGSASFDGSTDITITADIVADSIALGTDTTGDYVAGATAGSGIDISGSGGEGSTLTISNTGVLSLTGTANEVTVSASAGNVTVGLPNDVTIGGNLTVDGDLTVSGSTTYLNTATLAVEDNKILLNSNVTGAPSIDAGLEVERGDAANAELFWDESAGKWSASNGSSTFAISLEGHTHVAMDITDFYTEVDAEIDAYLVGSDSISISSGSIDTVLAGSPSASFLTNAGGLSVDKSALETALIADSFTRKYSLTIGDNSNTAFTVTHNLATRDVVVNVYDISTYETVEVDVVRTNTNTVTVTFASAPATNSYRVVVIG